MRSKQRVTHMVHHADPTIERNPKRETVVKHVSSKSISSYQVTGLALELSRKPDGTVGLGAFRENADAAFNALVEIQSKIDALKPNDQ